MQSEIETENIALKAENSLLKTRLSNQKDTIARLEQKIDDYHSALCKIGSEHEKEMMGLMRKMGCVGDA